MYRYPILFFLGICLFNSCQTKHKTPNTKESKNEFNYLENVFINDTFYLIKKDYSESNNLYREYIYKSLEHKFYTNIMSNYKDKSIPYLKTVDSTHKKEIAELINIPTEWTEVIYFGNEYYINYPSDFCSLRQKLITNSHIVNFECDGAYPQKIHQISQINPVQFQINIGEEKSSPILTITIIDSNKGIAIWEMPKGRYKLFADMKKINKSPLAVADCLNNKCAHEIKSQALNYVDIIRETLEK